MPQIGHCMQLTTVTDALRLMHTIGGNSVQISLGNPGDKTVESIAENDVRTALMIIQKCGFYLIVHGKYIYNFCRPGKSIQWQYKLLQNELTEAQKVSSDVIIHQGKNLKELGLSKEQAHQNFADNVSEILKGSSASNRIILENSCRQGTECGYTLDDLVDIYQRLDPNIIHRIGFCIDLCHIFVAGELDVRDVKSVRDWFDRFDAELGLDNLKVLHFNDSNTDFNGANDNHGSIGKGYIGKVSTKGMEYVVSLCTKKCIPMILETPSEYMREEITLLKKWSQRK
jgi:deoxyribonuclease IV